MKDDMLNGWGEIAAFLKVSMVTAWRYERNGGMPVVRLYHGQVRASKTEIWAWMVNTDADLRAVEAHERKVKVDES